MDLPTHPAKHQVSPPKFRILSLAGTKATLGDMVVTPLEHRGHQVDAKRLGPDVFSGLDDYQLIVVALNPNSPEGVSICSELRKVSKVPILVLVPSTASGQGLLALELGADSFMLTPFDRRELVSRSEALIRRYRHVFPT